MPEYDFAEQLDRVIDGLLADSPAPGFAEGDAEIAALARLASDLRGLPRENFKQRLKSEFSGRDSMSSVAVPSVAKPAAASARLTFKDVAKAIAFYERAFGARETFRFEAGGHIAHAEISIAESLLALAEEWPQGGRFSAETLGNSPVWLTIRVDDVDAFAAHAIAAGIKIKRSIQDQFYGHRDVLLSDPFGYVWSIYTVKEAMSVAEMHRRMQAMTTGPEGGTLPAQEEAETRAEEAQSQKLSPVLTPYLVAHDGDALLRFALEAFAAEQTMRSVSPTGGLHSEVRIGDSTLMIGGGTSGQQFQGQPTTTALHVYVEDTDAAYERALAAGATPMGAPQDHDYGERGAAVKDSAGNFWYIATHRGATFIPEGLRTVNPYLHPLRAEPVISFLKRAFAAEELARYASPDGVIHHAQVRLGDSVIEMGEAHGPYQPTHSMFYLYVPDADAIYHRALAAGATSIQTPADQSYGDRNAAVADAFGNTWYVATRIRSAHS